MDLSTFNTCVQGFLARMALHSAYERGDTTRIKRFFKTVEVGSLIGGLFMAVILVGLAISMFLTAYDSSQEAARNVPVIPAAAGAAPVQRVIDETGFITESGAERIADTLEDIADEYNIQAAVYSSPEPPHDVYDLFFSTDNGVVLYVEDHEHYGFLTYQSRDGLTDIFIRENIAILDEAQTYLAEFTHDRADNAVSDFKDGLRRLFYGAEQKSRSAPFEALTGVFWLLMAVVFYFVVRAMIFQIVGLPVRKKRREAALQMMLETAGKLQT